MFSLGILYLNIEFYTARLPRKTCWSMALSGIIEDVQIFSLALHFDN